MRVERTNRGSVGEEAMAARKQTVRPAASHRLAGRRIVITGAAVGIGRATAELFAAEGARIALFDRDAKALAAAAKATGGAPFAVDVSDEKAVRLAVAAAAKAMGGIDGVVNAAGITNMLAFADIDVATWRQVMEVNVTGTYLVCHAALPWLQKAKAATIVNIASGQALRPGAGGAAYGASKAAVMMFTKAIALELAPAIRANVVCPGATDTPMSRSAMLGQSKAKVAAFLEKNYAMKRFAVPAEIAAGILFLTSAESSFVTGVALPVDGGRSFH